MPPSVADWLPDGHLAWFVLDAVDELDLSVFEAAYRVDGRGGAAYHPRLMVGLLLYAYATGERSSRRIERRCVEDVAFRVVAANLVPDHATIARFRRSHEQALAGLFGQVLRLCVRAGLVQVSLVAVDGTRMEADASKQANRTAEQLAAEMLAEAEATDAAEDEQFGEARGDELPAEWASRGGRRERIRAALEQLETEQQAGSYETKLAEREQRETQTGRKVAGRKPSPDPTRGRPRQRANTTDPDSRMMSTAGKGFMQGYNAQTAATEDQIVVAAEVTNAVNDVDQLAPITEATTANLTDAGIGDNVDTIVADAGYYSDDNAELDIDADLLIATGKRRDQIEPVDIETRTREWEPIRQVDNGEISVRDAARQMSVSTTTIRKRLQRWRDGELLSIRERMEHKLANVDGQAAYAKRAATIEPIFGQTKHDRGIRRFMRRGLTACDSEWKLIMATHNIRKMWMAT